MKVIILCGGKGTRLRPYTHSIPKPMLLLGRKPILEYTIQKLKGEGFKEIILAVGHLKEQIMDYFGDGKKFGVKIFYSVEQDGLGDAGALKNAWKYVEKEENFLVLMADQLTNLDYRRMVKEHEKTKPIATVALKRIGIPLQWGIFETDSHGRIISLAEKPIVEKLANTAIYVFNKKVFEYLPDKGVLSTDVIPKLIAKKAVQGFAFDDYWIDVGSIREYEEINQAVSLAELISHVKYQD
ncbi:nucleotidyltransferase family protein [Candidatus Micrarchaeota archaeon]|nr:nucleotidyltransferase family protein [Candidatus Micrarchaeota archaeon]